MGKIVRAGIQDSLMVGILGVNTKALFTLVFGLGSFLAGLAGVLSAPDVRASCRRWGTTSSCPPSSSSSSAGWAASTAPWWAGCMLGIIVSMCIQFVPAVAELSMYLVMALVLLVRPRGLFGEEGLFE